MQPKSLQENMVSNSDILPYPDAVTHLFTMLRDEKIRYVFVRGYETVLDPNVGRDIDLLIHPDDKAKFWKLAMSGLLPLQPAAITRRYYAVNIFFTGTIYPDTGKTKRFQVDLVDPWTQGVTFADTVAVIERSQIYDGMIRVPAPADEFWITLMHGPVHHHRASEKHIPILSALWSKDPEGCCAVAKQILPSELVDQWSEHTWHSIAQTNAQVTKIRQVLRSHPARSRWQLCQHYAREIILAIGWRSVTRVRLHHIPLAFVPELEALMTEIGLAWGKNVELYTQSSTWLARLWRRMKPKRNACLLVEFGAETRAVARLPLIDSAPLEMDMQSYLDDIAKADTAPFVTDLARSLAERVKGSQLQSKES